MQQQIESDLKAALLSGDKSKAETLRGLKSAFLNEAIALGVKDEGLNDDQMQKVLQRESKKRSEAIELYEKAGAADRAAAEKTEKAAIDSYLPEQANEADVSKAVEESMTNFENPSMADMGKIIGAVRSKLPTADAGLIAKLVKEKIEP